MYVAPTGSSIDLDENVINNQSGSSGRKVTLKRHSPGSAVTMSIPDLTVKLDATNNPNSAQIVPFMGIWASTRATVNGLPAPFQITTKFVDSAAQEVVTQVTHSYETTLPSYSNRRYMLVYKENGTDTPDFVTNATLKTGTTDVQRVYDCRLLEHACDCRSRE